MGRFQNVTELRLAGLDLTDASSRLLVRYVPHLTRLDLSQCVNVTDQTVHTLTSPISPLRESLTHINLAGKHSFISGDAFIVEEFMSLTPSVVTHSQTYLKPLKTNKEDDVWQS